MGQSTVIGTTDCTTRHHDHLLAWWRSRPIGQE